eukprot:gene421-1820_t
MQRTRGSHDEEELRRQRQRRRLSQESSLQDEEELLMRMIQNGSPDGTPEFFPSSPSPAPEETEVFYSASEGTTSEQFYSASEGSTADPDPTQVQEGERVDTMFGHLWQAWVWRGARVGEPPEPVEQPFEILHRSRANMVHVLTQAREEARSHGLRVNMVISVRCRSSDDSTLFNQSHSTASAIVLMGMDISSVLDELLSASDAWLQEWHDPEHGSGTTFLGCWSVRLEFMHYEPLTGGTTDRRHPSCVPPSLQRKKALIDLPSYLWEENKCFLYAVAAGVHDLPSRDPQRPAQYEEDINRRHWETCSSWPMPLNSIHAFEEANTDQDISVNVLGCDWEHTEEEVSLLDVYLEGEEPGSTTHKTSPTFFVLYHTSRPTAHKCIGQQVLDDVNEETTFGQLNVQRATDVMFAIVSDVSLGDLPQDMVQFDVPANEQYTHHRYIAAKFHGGQLDAHVWFVQQLKALQSSLLEVLAREEDMKPLTSQEEAAHDAATLCRFCAKPLQEGNKVRDHSHVTG